MNPAFIPVRRLSATELQTGLGLRWLQRAVAELTHAPSGYADDGPAFRRLAPAAGADVDDPRSDETLLCVLGGRLRVDWGVDLAESVIAEEGEFVLIAAGIRHQLRNASDRDPVDYGRYD